jgi:hypothetical protein
LGDPIRLVEIIWIVARLVAPPRQAVRRAIGDGLVTRRKTWHLTLVAPTEVLRTVRPNRQPQKISDAKCEPPKENAHQPRQPERSACVGTDVLIASSIAISRYATNAIETVTVGEPAEGAVPTSRNPTKPNSEGLTKNCSRHAPALEKLRRPTL